MSSILDVGVHAAWHPALFSGPMIRAVLDGRKSETRRVIAGQTSPSPGAVTFKLPGSGGRTWSAKDREVSEQWQEHLPCPFGKPGDRLWCREAVFRRGGRWLYSADGEPLAPSEELQKWSDGKLLPFCPSMHMPRWASRICLVVTSLRPERLQTISARSILAEGVVERPHHDPVLGVMPVSAFDGRAYVDLLSLWRAGWDSLNGKRPGCSWLDDPFVWVVEFRRES